MRPLTAPHPSQTTPLIRNTTLHFTLLHTHVHYSTYGVLVRSTPYKHAHCPRQDASTTSITDNDPCACQLPSPLHPAPRSPKPDSMTSRRLDRKKGAGQRPNARQDDNAGGRDAQRGLASVDRYRMRAISRSREGGKFLAWCLTR